MPVENAFSIAGRGTVVTGKVRQNLVVAPALNHTPVSSVILVPLLVLCAHFA
jgi:hypothetical protein